MMDVVYCNQEQAKKILKTYFSHKPIITRVYKDSEDGIYFITARTVPRGLFTEWQWRGFACFGEVHKGDRRYDLNGSYPEELMKPLDDACRKAIENYEKGNDLFLNTSSFEDSKTYAIFIALLVTMFALIVALLF